jgi:glycerophosphoryl diester phosphodiesterase
VAVAFEAQRVVHANAWLARKARPLVVGHRGVPLLHQENTLAGARRAVALGLDAIEIDVRLTRDGRAVVFHDANVERLTGVRRAIADMTWDELSALRVASVVGAGARAIRYERTERISLLAEILAEVGDALAINIELKPRWFGDDVAAVVAADVDDAGHGARVLVTSYDPRKLRDAGRADPALALGYCWVKSMFVGGRRVVDRLMTGTSSVRAVGGDLALMREDNVRWLRGRGLAVGAHVVCPLAGPPTSDREIARLLALELDWIETDDPEWLMRARG